MRITVGRKLWIGFSSILFILIIVGISGLWALMKLNDEYQYFIDERVHMVLLLEQLLSNQNEDAKNLHGFMIYKDDVYLANREEISDSYKVKLKELDNKIQTTEARDLFLELKDASISFQGLSEIVIRDVNEGNLDSAQKIAAEGERFESIINDRIGQLTELQEIQQEQTEQELQLLLKWIQIIILSLIGVAVIVSIIIARILSQSIANPVRTMTEALQQIASGNFTGEQVKILNKDELGKMADALNGMVEDLRGIIVNARHSASQLSGHAEELSKNSEESLTTSALVAEISERNLVASELQTSSLKDSAISIDEMVTRINQITSDNEIMLSSSEEVALLVNNGATLMQNLTNQMRTIRATIGQSSNTIRDMATHSEQIRNVTSLISAIAEQTNLLALNAAIEAARAGEHGKGFTVVATEVRNLAEQSKFSAEKIGQMIDSMILEVTRTVSSSENGSQQIEEGLSVTEQTEDVFNRIEFAANDMREKITTVSVAIHHVRTMTEKISDESKNIAKLTIQTTAEAESTSSATEEQLAINEEISTSAQTLAELAEALQRDMARFEI